MENLQKALAELAKARGILDESTLKLTEMEPKLGPAATRLAEAQKRHTEVEAAVLLGEAKPGAAAEALSALNAARSAHSAIVSALDVLKARCAAASAPVREAQTKVDAAKREAAGPVADEDLRQLRGWASGFAEAFDRWFRSSSVARGGHVTGQTQQNLHGLAALLLEHGVRGGEYLQIGYDSGRLLSAEETLLRAQELASK